MELNYVVDRNWPTIQAKEPVNKAIKIIRSTGIEFLPVLEKKKLVGILRLSPMVLTTLSDIRDVAIELIMKDPNVTVETRDDWQKWGKIVSGPTAVLDKNQNYYGVTTPELINEALRKTIKLQLERYQTVQELNRELDAVIDCSSDGICITDGEGKILRLNPAFARVTGLENEEYLGVSLYKMLEEKVMTDSATIQVLEEKKPVTVMQQFYTGKQAISTAYPIFDDDNKIARVVTNIRDVTELNYLKQELEQSKKLTSRYLNELAELKKQQLRESNMVGQSEEIIQVLELAGRVAPVDTTVLLLGESGVGKENVAQLIHKLSTRNEKGSFVKLNCGAIPGELLESELFGYESGAFTGAKKEGKLGYFELAHEGTLFLDEVADLPLELQVKLLRVLQEQEILRLGGEKPIKVDVRIIAATNKNLEEMIAEGAFREDVYYRLNVVPIKIPPLRERREDVVPLVVHYIKHFNEKYNLKKRLNKETIDLLENYSWPGNVRELANLVERLVVTTGDDEIKSSHLPNHVLEQLSEGDSEKLSNSTELQNDKVEKNSLAYLEDQLGEKTLDDILAEVEQEILITALNKFGQNNRAADSLGVSLSTLNRRIRKYKLQKRWNED